MFHLVLVTCLVLLAFAVLVPRHPVEIAYVLLAWFPALIFLIAMAHVFVRGIQQFNHQLLHVAYDSSYALALLGICLTLRAVLKRRRVIVVVVATIVAGIPLGHILATQTV